MFAVDYWDRHELFKYQLMQFFNTDLCVMKFAIKAPLSCLWVNNAKTWLFLSL